MEKKAIIELLKKPQYLKLYSIDELQGLVHQYPHFKQLKMLLLKKTQMVQPEQAAQILPQIATDISNRSTLYNLLNKPIDNLPVQLEATKNKVMPISQEVINTVKRTKKVRLPKRKKSQEVTNPVEEVEKELIQLKLLAKKKAKQQKKTPSTNQNIKEAVSQDLEKLRMNTNFQTKSEDALLDNIRQKIDDFNESRNLKTQTPKSIENYSDEDIKQMMLTDKANMSEIYQFIEDREDERLQKDNILSAEEAAQNSSKQDMESVTETIALLYVKQGAVNKAIKVYEKLSLKYPKKSAYFAGKIKELKK